MDEVTQIRETQSKLVDKVADAEHRLTEATAEGVKSFRESEAFRRELLTSCWEAFLTWFN